MSVRAILAWPDARLAQPAAPVADRAVEALVTDMFETMYAAPGIGLAAPQLGEMLRLFVMDCGWKSGRAPRLNLPPGLPEAAAGLALLALAVSTDPASSAAWLLPVALPLLAAPLMQRWLDRGAA